MDVFVSYSRRDAALLWAFLLGYVVWHDIPVPAVLAGAGLIVAAGALLVVTEHHPLEPKPQR